MALATPLPLPLARKARPDVLKRAIVGIAGILGLGVLGVVAQLPITIVGAIVMVPLSALGVAFVLKRPELMVPFTFGSMWFEGVGVGQIRLGRIVAIAIFLLPLALAATTNWRPSALQARAWLPPFLVMAWVWITGLWSQSLSFWTTGVGQYAVGFAFFLAGMLFIESFDHARQMFRIWLWVGIPVAVLSDVTYFLVAPTIRDGEAVRVFGFSGSPNNFALYLVIAVAMCVAFSRETVGRERIFYRLLIPLFCSALVTSGSRSGLIALGILAYYQLATVRNVGVLKRIGVLLGGTVGIAAVGLLIIIINPRLNPLGIIADQGSGRTEILTIGNQAAKDHWFWGLGAGNFKAVASEYAHTQTGLDLENLKGVSKTLSPEIHSIYVQLVAETGIFGLFTYLLMLATTMKNNWDLRRTQWREFSWAITGSYIVFILFAAQTPVTNQKMQWMIAGVVGGFYVRRRRQRHSFRLSDPIAAAATERGELIDR